MMNTPWHIELLGRLRATQGDCVLTRFRARRTGALLAYLAYYLDRPHPREVLIELFWPEAEPGSGRNNLSRELNSLRRQLEPPGVPAGAVVVADRNTVQLNPTACTTDVQAFEAALHTAARARSSTERAERLAEAVDLCQGELLPGYFEEWILPERQRLAEAYLQALEELVGRREQAGDLSRALEYARRAVAVDPLREGTYGHLFRLLVASGQPEAARRAYRDLERRLQQELGEAVSAATRQLVHDLEQTGAPRPERQQTLEKGQPTGQQESVAPGPTPPGQELPSGTVTFLLTDVVRSTALWEQAGPSFRSALSDHHELLRREFERHGGREVKEAGDSFVVAFSGAAEALACGIAAQRALTAHAWPEEVGRLQVRMALHTGDVELEKGEYRSLVLHHAARMLVAAHGGQIVASEVTTVLLRRSSPGALEAGVQIAELGLYRLRDITTPERLFQVNYPGMAQPEFPPLNVLPVHEGNLPLQFTRFFGREAEIAQLVKAVGITHSVGTRPSAVAEARSAITDGRQPRDDGPCLITLTGPGGSGKTRLALEVASQLRTRFHGAVWFVPLQDLTDARLIPDKLLDSLRLPRSPEMEPLEQAVAFLSRQPSLLLLDNFEQLVADGAPLVQSLLEQLPALTCLITSRQRLNLPGEQEFSVAPLPVPVDGQWSGTREAGGVDGPVKTGSPSPLTISHQPSTLMQCPSVRLFMDRAQAARPDFQVTRANAGAVAQLCARLEGLPLALELAAARAGVMTPEQMLGRLDERLNLLTTRQRGAAARHRSLRAALDWSYQLLSPELQRFFARLSVFRGGWGLEAAEAICRAPDTLEYLEQFRECSLVQAVETAGEMRFRLLETLREYGAEQLGTEEREAVADRHAAFYLALAERAEPEMFRADQVVWFDRLEQELDNIRSALAWLETSGRIQEALQLGGILWRFWHVRGHHREAQEWLMRLLARDEAVRHGDDDAKMRRARALNAAALLAWYQGNYETTRQLAEESLTIGRTLNDLRTVLFSLTNLGFVAHGRGEFGKAQTLFDESLAIARELGDLWSGADLLNTMGELARNRGNAEEARSLLEEGLRIFRELGDRQSIAVSLRDLGHLAWGDGDRGTAKALLEESLALRRELGDQRGAANTICGLGGLAADEGDCEEAQTLLDEGLTLLRELGERRGAADALARRAEITLRQGDPELARTFLDEALAISRELGYRAATANILRLLALTAQQQGDDETAQALAEESLTFARRPGTLDALEGRGRRLRRH
jgi:predicted ATPase/DNA-binding SARP family transcriptional activator